MVKKLFPTSICNQATSYIRRPNAEQPVTNFSLHTFRPLVLRNFQSTHMHGLKDMQIEKSEPKQKLENWTANQSLISNSFRYPTLKVDLILLRFTVLGRLRLQSISCLPHRYYDLRRQV